MKYTRPKVAIGVDVNSKIYYVSILLSFNILHSTKYIHYFNLVNFVNQSISVKKLIQLHPND